MPTTVPGCGSEMITEWTTRSSSSDSDGATVLRGVVAAAMARAARRGGRVQPDPSERLVALVHEPGRGRRVLERLRHLARRRAVPDESCSRAGWPEIAGRVDGVDEPCGSSTNTCSSRSPAPSSQHHGTTTTRTTASTACRTSACGSHSTRSPQHPGCSSSPGHTSGAGGSSRGSSSTRARTATRTTASSCCPTAMRWSTASGCWAGMWSPATYSPSTTARCTARPGNSLPTRRRAVSLRWLGDDARFGERPWTTSPPYEPNGLVVGGPLDDDPRFPLVVG